MNKYYFEMSDTERQLNLINNNLDYAICVFSEGLPIQADASTIREAIRLQSKITETLLDVSEDIETMLKIAQEDE